MTRPTQSALVLDGSQVKMRLEAERAATGSHVHVDWVRFTTTLRNAPAPDADLLFPPGAGPHDAFAVEGWRKVSRLLRALPDGDHDPAAQARELAQQVAQALGAEFAVAADIRKGHDFYKHRWAIERNGTECGWIGFLSSGDSPRQQAQSRTLHANVWGSACTFAEEGWTLRLANLIDACKGTVTRVDLAADFFDGLRGGMDRVMADYKAGGMDSGGKRLKSNCVGDWANGRERSFYFGSKEAGKQTNVYEKGDQLFGVDAWSPWMRAELRFGNKLRVLPSDMLRRPSDFFAGASDWHALVLAELQAQAVPEPIKCRGRLALETVAAEVTRNTRWLMRTAGPTVAAMFTYGPERVLEAVVSTMKLPARLRKFGKGELREAFAGLEHKFSWVEGASPAFA
jgi:phage replication initiation protein